MELVTQLLRGIEFVPALVEGIEALFGDRPGAQKKNAAMSFLLNALTATDVASEREIADPEGFKDGISRIVDGVVQCMNASSWSKEKPKTPQKAQGGASSGA
jgi:hypothetical protein